LRRFLGAIRSHSFVVARWKSELDGAFSQARHSF
jgi:hypothetical protein